jgi:signal transduction histidine kinase
MNATSPAPTLARDQRWRPLRTLRFALVVALIFTLLNFALTSKSPAWSTDLGWWIAGSTSLVFALCISFTIELLFVASRRLFGVRLARWLVGPRRYVYYWGVPLLGLVIGLPSASLLTGALRTKIDGPTLPATPLGAAVFMLLVTVAFFGFFTIRGWQQRAERQALEAQLKLLQGQIEPHFLFNTLANVVGLMESDTPRAKLMLESFVDYLRSSLGGMRKADHTLGDELELVEAYLRVIQIRMEDRLHYTIAVPDELRRLELPALTLQPLVENAVLHGLEPKIDGGSVRIAARLDDVRGTRTLVLTVEDDGLGLRTDRSKQRSGNDGSGTALANTRERLAQAYGAAAALGIEPVSPSGVRATLALPAHAGPATLTERTPS